MEALAASTKYLIHKPWRSAVQKRLPEPASAILLKSPVSIRVDGTTVSKWRVSETRSRGIVNRHGRRGRHGNEISVAIGNGLV